MRSASVRRVRRQRPSGLSRFIVTWDVDSGNGSQCARLRRFVFGYKLNHGSTVYRYPGFVERSGVRYLGQSVLFVTSDRLAELREFLRTEGIPHVVATAWLGDIVPS